MVRPWRVWNLSPLSLLCFGFPILGGINQLASLKRERALGLSVGAAKQEEEKEVATLSVAGLGKGMSQGLGQMESDLRKGERGTKKTGPWRQVQVKSIPESQISGWGSLTNSSFHDGVLEGTSRFFSFKDSLIVLERSVFVHSQLVLPKVACTLQSP